MTLQNVKLLNLFKYIVKRGCTALASSDNCEKESILILKKQDFFPVIHMRNTHHLQIILLKVLLIWWERSSNSVL